MLEEAETRRHDVTGNWPHLHLGADTFGSSQSQLCCPAEDCLVYPSISHGTRPSSLARSRNFFECLT